MSILDALKPIAKPLQMIFDPKNHSGIGNLGNDSALTEDQLRAKQLALLQQQIADAKATQEANKGDWASLSNDLFGTTPSAYSGPMASTGGSYQLGPQGLNDQIQKVFGVEGDQGSTAPGNQVFGDLTELKNALNPKYSVVKGVQEAPTSAPVPNNGSLGSAYAKADTADAAALENFKNAIGGIKDPALAGYVGDMTSEAANAGANPEDIAAQSMARDKLLGLTDTKETAEEKFMREMARRNQESTLRAQREALKNDLQARGVYGSGAEIGMNLGAQQEAASRRALEELGADANASRRAMDALGKYSDLVSTMRTQGANESQFRGTAADKAAAFNKSLKQQDDQFRAKTLMEQNQQAAARAGSVLDASRLTSGSEANRASDLANKKIQVTGGKTGSALAGQQAAAAPVQTLGNLFGTQADVKHAEGEDDTPFGMVKGIFG